MRKQTNTGGLSSQFIKGLIAGFFVSSVVLYFFYTTQQTKDDFTTTPKHSISNEKYHTETQEIKDYKTQLDEALHKISQKNKGAETTNNQKDGYVVVKNIPPPFQSAEYQFKGFKSANKKMKASDLPMSDQDRGFIKKHGIDLRGLHCTWIITPEGNEQERCYLHDEQGYVLCPPHVTSLWLSKSPDQWLCSPDAPEYYCTVSCQDNNDEAKWTAHNIAVCEQEKNCAPQPPVIPYEQFELAEYVPPVDGKKRKCSMHSERKLTIEQYEAEQSLLQMISVGILVRCIDIEKPTFNQTMRTYRDGKLLESVGEVIIRVNSNDGSCDSLLEEYKKPPYNARVIGNGDDLGIGASFNQLVEESKGTYFLFLEKDFVLTESSDCWKEQLIAGANLLSEEKAHVIKYRGRHYPGRPNWSVRMFRGKEETIFTGQRNIFCFFYHWIENPDKRWPDYFTKCGHNPDFYCVLSEYCSWTNNPNMITREWWISNYVEHLDKFGGGVWGLEGWLNSKEAWVDKKWIVASGDGMFAHLDKINYGSF
eukprot:TRINITY_DN9397_c0_g1_i2.p1 TRINITY_DN9397_c0_g1~~TRINITY_DN9397_c0_g1_i2.p1  ORF type:complete len:535 (+),score=87.61 TRINITY_DN9397_c0_g1_i2:49-1653(+)